MPDNDFLLYFPVDDLWQRIGGRPLLMFDIHRLGELMPDIQHAVHEILNAGYDSDYISDALLNRVTVGQDGTVNAEGGASYSAIIVPSVKIMPTGCQTSISVG